MDILSVEVATLAKQRAQRDATAAGDSDIQQFYAGKSVFITGGTGFMGKQLIEKLLRACYDVKKIYLLIREKKGKDAMKRLADMMEDPLYDELRNQRPNFMDQLEIVEGDISEIGLGLSDKDRDTLIDEVHIILHCAATVRFDDPLKKSVLTNVRGTRELFDLATSCRRLLSVVHVSTAFSNCHLITVEERFYPIHVPYEGMIQFAETMDEDALQKMAPSLLGDFVNTYTFTKAMAENVAKSKGEKLPVAVFRPAIVTSTYREPVSGWTDVSALFGALGVIMGIGLGLIKTMLVRADKITDLVPVDFANNSIIAIAWRTACDAARGPVEAKVFTYSSAKANPITWMEQCNIYRNEGRRLVSPCTVWYTECYLLSSELPYRLMRFLFHTIPAHVIDAVTIVMGKDLKLRKLVLKIHKLSEVTQYFNNTHVDFKAERAISLYDSLSEKDKVIFPSDVRDIHWREYIQLIIIGLRRFIVKDNLKDTEIAIKRQTWFKYGHYAIVCLYLYLFYKLTCLLYYVCANIAGMFYV